MVVKSTVKADAQLDSVWIGVPAPPKVPRLGSLLPRKAGCERGKWILRLDARL